MRDGPERTWTPDNGDGSYTNPLFYDEFSDPDLIRVGDDFYLTGTTMHTMPGLPVLHSVDLVNWTHLGYACDRLDLGPEFRLENGRESYGQGIWAPCLRYHDGVFYIFSNVNGYTTQLFRATDPAGPWTRTPLKRAFHDLSVLFDDGKVYVVWGYQGIHLAQLNDALDDIVPGSERLIIPPEAGMGEGVHFYRIEGTYFILSAWFAGRMRMPCARAEQPEGPYEVNLAISADEDFGLREGARLGRGSQQPPFEVVLPDPRSRGRMSLHQGGIVDTPSGEWWGFSMMDYNSVGRLTCLSPITWHAGWPYFGLPGNLERTPRTWLKPDTGRSSPPAAPYERNDDFDGPELKPIWQWSHVPDDTRWSLSERPGALRLHALPAADFWWARNSLTQRAIGPRSSATVELDAAGLSAGDCAGLALLNLPYAWIGVRRDGEGLLLEQFDQTTGRSARVPLAAPRVLLRVECDFLTERARFAYSAAGGDVQPLGDEFAMVYQLKTFQGVRLALFCFNTAGAPGGFADFLGLSVEQPDPRGLMRPIPVGASITLATAGAVLVARPDGIAAARPDAAQATGAAAFEVVDRGHGRVALKAAGGFLSVAAPGTRGQVTLSRGEPGDAETFQWTETPYGDLVLLSIATQRLLRADPHDGVLSADHRGPSPQADDGACFQWLPAGQS